ncbi:hypothetical protein O181_064251 [Austropuccinia psidii MF-1]|uniref:Ribosomal protein L9 domain-containing protein n=1 Tax=Austropuccinia psidii MF-1 TaxID=1389203 RepID=A0A9Q3ELL1_9BASI|nr:hypothetical protein [Austropuccinia psidii MF-1]
MEVERNIMTLSSSLKPGKAPTLIVAQSLTSCLTGHGQIQLETYSSLSYSSVSMAAPIIKFVGHISPKAVHNHSSMCSLVPYYCYRSLCWPYCMLHIDCKLASKDHRLPRWLHLQPLQTVAIGETSLALKTILYSLFPSARSFASSSVNFVWVQKRIQVKLRSDHPIYGKAGDVIRVKPGHMRQQLYPFGHALYCAKDRIPIHHFQPATNPRSHLARPPPPGLSRPLTELLKRLGVKMSITRAELRKAQAQIDEWKRSANSIAPIQSKSQTSTPSTPASSSSILSQPPPKELDEYLQQLSEKLLLNKLPLLTFNRSASESSNTLYSSIKLEEILTQLIKQIESEFDQTINLSSYLKIIGCERIEDQEPPHQTKIIKKVGDYHIKVKIFDPHQKLSTENSHDDHTQNYHQFKIQIIKS